MKIRTAIFILLCALVWTGKAILDNRIRPRVSTQLAVRALNGTDDDQTNLLNSKKVFDWLDLAPEGATLLVAGLCFGSLVRPNLGRKGQQHA
jgi:hypothetical protein